MESITRLCVYSIVFLFALPLSAQTLAPPEIAWNKSYDFGGQDVIFGVHEIREGEYIVAANKSHVVEKEGQEGILIASVSSNGVQLWTREHYHENPYINLSGSKMKAEIKTTDSTQETHYIIVGNSSFSDDHTDERGYILIIRSNGEKLWENYFSPSSEYEYVYSSLSISENGYIVCGKKFTVESGHPFIAHYASSGNFFGYDILENGVSSITSIASPPKQDTIIFGSCGRGWGYPCIYEPASDRIKTCGEVGNATSIVFVTQHADGGYLCLFNSGYFTDSIGKIDENGNILWSKPVSSEFFSEVAPTQDGGCVIATTANIFIGNADIVVQRISPTGESMWAQRFFAPKNESALAITQTQDGGYLIGGMSMDSNSDSYLLRLEPEKGAQYSRGDVNMDRKVDISDSIAILGYLFLGSSVPCIQAGEVNNDSKVDISDAIYILGFLFLGNFSRPEGYASCT